MDFKIVMKYSIPKVKDSCPKFENIEKEFMILEKKSIC
jgi:hypothetical protein